MSTKFVFITGGVVSSLGKGLATASLGALLQARGYKVRVRKLDPYLNIDPGTMSPTQHGEVFVTVDGAETDLDLGHYERFVGIDAKKGDNITSGKLYEKLLKKERRGDYLGATVQVIPHVTNLIKEFITDDLEGIDFLLCEIGGTVGDIEALPFFEAIRQLKYELGQDLVKFVHLTLVPYISSAKELKTKPTQHSVKELSSIGIQPDVLLCRSEKEIPEAERKKIALFCNIREEAVIPGLDVKNIYEAPISLHNHGFDVQVLKAFGIIADPDINLQDWYNYVERNRNTTREVKVALVGKYVKLRDAYKSVAEALCHAANHHQLKVSIKWVNSRNLTQENIEEKLGDVNAILVPGGFGYDGTEGKMLAIQYAREKKVPYLGICLGMQLATIEFAKNVCGIADAVSSEFFENGSHVVGLMTEWVKEGGTENRSKDSDLGGTMRLGNYPCILSLGTLAEKTYASDHIEERHRHRYEININLIEEKFRKFGMIFSGMSPDGTLPEIMELQNHPWFIACQFHPELKSRPFTPHPLFVGFIGAAGVNMNIKEGNNVITK